MHLSATQTTYQRVFPEQTMARTGTDHLTTGERLIRMEPARKIFERKPSHILESRWAFYANINKLNAEVIETGKLPRLILKESILKWITKSGFSQWDKLNAHKPCTYIFGFVPTLMIGEFNYCEWKFLSECADLDTHNTMCFRHDAPAPVVPLPDCRVTHLEMPPELVSAVEQGMKQAEEELIVQLGLQNPVITGMIA